MARLFASRRTERRCGPRGSFRANPTPTKRLHWRMQGRRPRRPASVPIHGLRYGSRCPRSPPRSLRHRQRSRWEYGLSTLSKTDCGRRSRQSAAEASARARKVATGSARSWPVLRLGTQPPGCPQEGQTVVRSKKRPAHSEAQRQPLHARCFHPPSKCTRSPTGPSKEALRDKETLMRPVAGRDIRPLATGPNRQTASRRTPISLVRHGTANPLPREGPGREAASAH